MTSYDWGRPGATALVVPFPEAEAVMGDFRRAHTPSGRDGMPAHATIIAPFIHASSIGLPESATIRDTLRRFVAFDVSLEAFGCFEHIGCLYLEPDPSEPSSASRRRCLRSIPRSTIRRKGWRSSRT